MASPNSAQPGHESITSSTGLSLNLSSNNPFRNRAASPGSSENAFSSPSSPFDDPPPPPRPVSRNPFIDQPPPPLKSPGAMSNHSEPKSLSAEDIFDSLTLDDKKATETQRKSPPPQRRLQGGMGRLPRGDNAASQLESGGSHRSTRSQEDTLRARRKPGVDGSRPGPSQSPQRRMQPQSRSRGKSDAALIDFDSKPITEEEMKIIEERRRASARDRQKREGREAGKPREGLDGDKPHSSREGKTRDKSGRPGRPGKRLDIIDQLDASSIYGSGLFHHDGPFDALNPHRNRNTSRRAPMQAFPKDSLNNAIGGSGPLNPNPDHATFMGHSHPEAFRDYATSGRGKEGYQNPNAPQGNEAIFDPVSRGYLVHGDESYGLGTSTFLEGAPAAKAAIARHQAEQAQAQMDGGLQRKKSLAQRIRHINKGQRDFNPSGRMTNPEETYSRDSPGVGPSAATASAGDGSDANPFFSEFNKGEDTISVRPRAGATSPNGPPAVYRRESGAALERRATTDATRRSSETPAKPTGILGRMKSLKASKKPRNPETANGQPAAPGTAV